MAPVLSGLRVVRWGRLEDGLSDFAWGQGVWDPHREGVSSETGMEVLQADRGARAKPRGQSGPELSEEVCLEPGAYRPGRAGDETRGGL